MSNPRPWFRLFLGGFTLVGLTCLQASAQNPPPRPTLTVRAIHPDREVESVFKLFEGTRVANPAAALVAWKRASAEPKRLGKPLEAVIAAINPRMLAEYRLLDDAEVSISLVPGSARYSWQARLPNDDGTLAALGPTGVLSGGGLEPPIGEVAVDRLGAVGSALLARGPSALILASSRDQLAAALDRPKGPTTPPPFASGLLVEVDPSASDTWTSLAGRRWAEAARVTRCLALSGQARIEGGTLGAGLVGRLGSIPPALAAIDPAWLDAIPGRGPLAAFGFRVDPRPESWNAVFDLIDRVDRVEPERANVASTRIRAALAARAAGVRLEADVWPHLAGVSGWVGVAEGVPDRALVAIHLDDPAAARRILGGLKGRRAEADLGFDEAVELGPVAARPLRVIRRQASLYLAWGDRAWPESLDAINHPERSARPWLSSSRTGRSPSRVGAVWADLLPRVPSNTPLASALAEGSPIRWAGWNEADRTRDEVWVDGLGATVRRFLERIPLDPPQATNP